MTNDQKDKIWYPPNIGIVFRHFDSVLWLLENIREIDESKRWPLEPSNYTDPGIHLPLSAQCASFVTPSEMVTEALSRCVTCGRDGRITVSRYLHGMTIEEIAEVAKLPEWDIERRIRHVINYISSGRCGRWRVCYDCLESQKSCRQRKEKTYNEWISHR